MEFEVRPNKGKVDILAAKDNPRGTFRLFTQNGNSYDLAFEGTIGCLGDIYFANSILTEAISVGSNAFYIVHPKDLDYPNLIK